MRVRAAPCRQRSDETAQLELDSRQPFPVLFRAVTDRRQQPEMFPVPVTLVIYNRCVLRSTVPAETHTF